MREVNKEITYRDKYITKRRYREKDVKEIDRERNDRQSENKSIGMD